MNLSRWTRLIIYVYIYYIYIYITAVRKRKVSIKSLIYFQTAPCTVEGCSASLSVGWWGRWRRGRGWNGRLRVILRQKPRDSSSPLIGGSGPQKTVVAVFFFCEISSTPPSRVVIDPQWQLRVVAADITTPFPYCVSHPLFLSPSRMRQVYTHIIYRGKLFYYYYFLLLLSLNSEVRRCV